MKTPINVTRVLIAAATAITAVATLTSPPQARAQIPSSLFMQGFNKSTSTWCPWDGNSTAALIYGYRIWDDGLKWSQIQPTNTIPTFTAFDTTVNTRARGNNTQAGSSVAIGAPCPGTPMPVNYTNGATPEWASACFGQGDPSPCLPGPAGTTTISSTCSITSGTATLTCPSPTNPFTAFSSPEGPAISITGAGPGGATLTTYISAFTSSSQVTLAANASTTVTSTGTSTLLGFGGGTQCSSPAGNGDFGCTPPSDIATNGTGNDAFYSTLIADIVARYSGKIKYYEIWNEADSPNFWCNQGAPAGCGGGNPLTTANTPSLSRLVRMGWDLKNIVACVDPTAKVFSPSMHVATALTWFHFYNITSISAPAGVSGVNGVPIGCNWSAATVTGKMTYDYVNIHARGTSVASPNLAGNWNPAAIITAITNIKTEIANDSLPNPTIIINNEFGFNGATEGGNNVDNYAAFMAQSYIFCASLGLTQCYWYQWDTTTLGPNGTLQGTAYDTVAGYLIGATITVPCAEVGTIWTCGLTKSGVAELLAWDASKNCNSGCTTANQVYGALYTNYVDLTGASHPTSGGTGTAPTGWKPILLQQLAAAPAPPLTVNGTVKISGSTTNR